MSVYDRRSNAERSSDRSVSHDERRRVCRYAVVQGQAWLGWWHDQAFLNTPARILDISLRGARLAVDSAPPPDKPVWFCPPSAVAPEWMEAKLVLAKKRFFGPREIRIAFRKLFPYEMFKVLVYGSEATQGYTPQPIALPSPDDDYEW